MDSINSNRVMLINPSFYDNPDEVTIDRVTENTGTKELNISFVTFPPGVRRPWNSHDKDQYVWTLNGKGILFTVQKKIKIEPGAMVFIPAGLKHQHGASEDEHFTQISIIGGK